jgi:hypothetical protein
MQTSPVMNNGYSSSNSLMNPEKFVSEVAFKSSENGYKSNVKLADTFGHNRDLNYNSEIRTCKASDGYKGKIEYEIV